MLQKNRVRGRSAELQLGALELRAPVTGCGNPDRQSPTTWNVTIAPGCRGHFWDRIYWVTVNGPSNTVRLMTSVLAWCGPCLTPLGAKKKAPVV